MFNGAGIFDRLYSWASDAANDILVRSDRMDNEMDGFADGLSNCITRDGQSPALANIPMGGNKFTGLGIGASPSDSVNYAQVFVNPVFTNASASASPPAGDSSLSYATTAFVAATAFASILPGISTATAGLAIVNDGVSASWGTPRNSSSRVYAFRNL